MKTVDIRCRVLYADTDAMGVVYYANYLRFYEMGRNAYLRALNISETDIKNQGIIFPAISVDMQYLIPAKLHDNLVIKTGIVEIPRVRLMFKQSIYHIEKGLMNEATITLAAVKVKNMRPTRCPDILKIGVKAMIQDKS